MNIVKVGETKQQLKLLYVLSIILAFLFLIFFSPIVGADTPSYFKAGDVLFSGSVDILRTPIYPFLCHVVRTLSPNHAEYILYGLQMVVFLVSIYFFYRIVEIFMNRQWLLFATVAIYVLYFIDWTRDILTESLSISVFIVFFYCTIQNIRKSSVGLAIASFLCLTFLVFIRPIFIFLFPIMLILWAYMTIASKSLVYFRDMVFTIVAIGSFAYYCGQFKKTYGIFAPSDVSLVNQYCVLKANDVIDTTKIENPSLRGDLQRFIKKNDFYAYFSESEYIAGKYGGWKGLSDIEKEIIKNNKVGYIKSVFRRFIERTPPGSMASHIWQDFIGIVMFLSLLSIVLSTIRNKRLPLLTLLAWCCVEANILTSFLGAQDGYDRLILPVMPLFFVLLAMMVEKGAYKVNTEVEYK